jgi:hypothetical protein
VLERSLVQSSADQEQGYPQSIFAKVVQNAESEVARWQEGLQQRRYAE